MCVREVGLLGNNEFEIVGPVAPSQTAAKQLLRPNRVTMHGCDSVISNIVCVHVDGCSMCGGQRQYNTDTDRICHSHDCK